MTTDYPLTIEEFRNWLKSKGEEDVVGETGKPTSCPLANALLQCTYVEEGNQVRVGYLATDIDPYFISETLSFENPSWVKQFIERVDVIESTRVTAKDVIEVLEEVKKYDLFN